MSKIASFEDNSKYRLVCLNRCVFINLDDVTHVSQINKGIYNVHFKDLNKSLLRIRRNSLSNLLSVRPNIRMV